MVFCKKGVLKNFAKVTGKQLWQSLFFNKVTDLRPGNLLKTRLWYRCFPLNFAKFLGARFLTEQLWWLLLCFLFSIVKSEDTSQIHNPKIHDLLKLDKRHFYKIQEKIYQWKILFNTDHTKQPQGIIFSRKNNKCRKPSF